MTVFMLCDTDQLNPIFIGGTGRSGTTVLKKVLKHHPAIVGLDKELRLLIDPGGVLDLVHALTDRWSPYAADIALRNFRKLVFSCGESVVGSGKLMKAFKRLRLSPPSYFAFDIGKRIGEENYFATFEKLMARLVRHITDGNWAGTPSFRFKPVIYETGPFDTATLSDWISTAFSELYIGVAKGATVRYWVDDTPYNILHAEELFTLFPSALLIHIYRDPRDVVASHRTKQWGGDDISAIATRVRTVLERWAKIKQRLPNESVFEISLESFVENPKRHLQTICDRLGLPYDAAFEEVLLDKAHSGRWKTDLSPRDIETMEAALGPLID